MSVAVERPEIFGVTESSLSLAFDVCAGGEAVDVEATVLVNGEPRATIPGGEKTRFVRIEGLAPDSVQRVDVVVAGAAPPERNVYFPEEVETHAAPAVGEVARFATLNDLHFGEPRFGGVLDENGDYGPDAPGQGSVRESDTEVPYWHFMNHDAIDEINAAKVDLALIKGDIADRGLRHQFEAAAAAFARFEMPHHAFLGNHDHYGRLLGEEVDGYALLGQPPAPRTLSLAGWRLVLCESTEPGEHHGVFPEERLAWLAAALEESRERREPTLVFMHHHPVPPEHADTYPNTIGLVPEHSLRLYELIGRHPQVRAVIVGHTHRNRVRRHRSSGATPYVEVNCTKDYPGGWAHYRLFEDGSFRQEVRRTATPRALAHSTRCRELFKGFYRLFALGELRDRSFVVPPLRGG